MSVATRGGGQGSVWFSPTRGRRLVPEEWKRVEDNTPTLDPSSRAHSSSVFQSIERSSHAAVNKIESYDQAKQGSQCDGSEALALYSELARILDRPGPIQPDKEDTVSGASEV